MSESWKSFHQHHKDHCHTKEQTGYRLDPAGEDKKHIEGHAKDRKHDEPVKPEVYNAEYKRGGDE